MVSRDGHSADVWQLLEASAGVVGSPEDVAKMFQTAKAQGINLIRFFPFGASSAFQLQTSPGNNALISQPSSPGYSTA